ncbi:rpl13 (nucleomorph) [Hemiselmis andersenii]|uniref:Rpl13 n=1 Tax=Hemiselmis andersenii TaxID=464988 RepID=A9BKM0_HEMAN|nr:rpl13 [Hemiselmis andersenii]ABW98025.1 rpl13 [Hemiselmis andersenii]|mmetsp:Transcript_11991/g.27986  ORF Transcript_11991/g.27986 Transcript_11991/m.27986 type:complete len:223 (+) Transcript_11991:46-714(+)
MVKHNNTTKSGHFKKSWQKKVKTWFKSPSKKLKRRNNRNKINKYLFSNDYLKKIFRPIVHCPTKVHNLKVKIGRGFSYPEILNTGISSKKICSLGISVDKRRKNRKKNRQFNEKRLENYFKNINVTGKKKVESLMNNSKKEKDSIKKKEPVNFKLEYVYNLNKEKENDIQSYRIIMNHDPIQNSHSKKFFLPGFLKYGKWTVSKNIDHLFNWSEVENFYTKD